MKAHFEINLVPLTIGITQAFYKRIMAFCFPEKTGQDHYLSSVSSTNDSSGASNEPTLSYYRY